MANGIIRLDEGWRLDEGHRLDEPPHVPPIVIAPAPKRKKKKGIIMADYIPNKRNDLYMWLKNLSDNIDVEGPKMGVPAADVTAAKAFADDLIAKMDATDSASAALDGVRDVERTASAADIAGLRAKVRNWKTLPGYAASGSEAVLKLAGSASAFDPINYKPAITATAEPGRVRIDFLKKGVDGLAVYSRGHGGRGTDTSAQYFDTAPLAQAGQPEVREYKARGMVNDEEIGLDSDIVSVTFPG